MKTKPFNLEQALTGAKVVTRFGKEVSQLTLFKINQKHCLYGLVDGALLSWTFEGFYYDGKPSHDYDLFLAVETKKIYVNVYEHNNKIVVSQMSFSNRENAIKDKNNYEGSFTFCKYIKTIEITDEPEIIDEP